MIKVALDSKLSNKLLQKILLDHSFLVDDFHGEHYSRMHFLDHEHFSKFTFA